MVSRKARRTGKTRKSQAKSKRKPRWGILLAVCVLAAAVAGGFVAWHTFFKPPKIRNVLLISIDTCRSDHLSCYGYPSKTTPNIDAIAAQSTLFQNVYSPIPMTLPAHCSMLTGMNPPYHGIHDNNEYGFTESGQVTLAQMLRNRGLNTAGIVSSFVLDNRLGLNQGFNTYMDGVPANPQNPRGGERKGGETTRLALDFLQRSGSLPFFLFLHYYDPHLPYEPPEPFASQFRADPYAGEIAFVDACIGQVIDKLKNLGLYDSTLLVITGDHGEMLGEHGESNHSFFLYQGALKVPLIVRLPGQKRGRIVMEPAGLVDIVPTICGLMQAKYPAHMQGVDLTAYLRGTKLKNNGSYYCESLTPTKFRANSLLGIVQGAWKYIQTTRPELYNLENDPAEAMNLASSEPERAADMQNCLKSMLEKEVRARTGGNAAEWDPQATARLAALGYVRGSVVEDFTFAADKEDPKDIIGFYEDYANAQNLYRQGKYAEAGNIGRKMQAARPNDSHSYVVLASIAFEKRDFSGAADNLRKAIELDPQDYLHHSNLADALLQLGKAEEAFEQFEQAHKLEPRSSDVLANHGLALCRLRRLDEALQKFQKAIQMDPKCERAYIGVAQARRMQGRMEDAIAEYRKALDVNPNNAETRNDLADLLYSRGAKEDALDQWSESLRRNPKQPHIQDILAQCSLELGRADQAVAILQSVLRDQPNNPRIMSQIAIIKADSHYPQYFNPAEALSLAKRACELASYQDPFALCALAAALTATGKHADAIQTASKALQIAEQAKDAASAKQARKILEISQRDQQRSRSK